MRHRSLQKAGQRLAPDAAGSQPAYPAVGTGSGRNAHSGRVPLKLTQEGEIAIKYAKRIRNAHQNLGRVWAIRSVTSPGCP